MFDLKEEVFAIQSPITALLSHGVGRFLEELVQSTSVSIKFPDRVQARIPCKSKANAFTIGRHNRAYCVTGNTGQLASVCTTLIGNEQIRPVRKKDLSIRQRICPIKIAGHQQSRFAGGKRLKPQSRCVVVFTHEKKS